MSDGICLNFVKSCIMTHWSQLNNKNIGVTKLIVELLALKA